MKQVITTEKKPIKLWLDDIEEGALEQAKNLANLPFIHKHIAIMPDSHQGYGMPIGAVMATKGIVVPNAVGVDIGCGMCAVKTSLTEIDREILKKIMGEISRPITTYGIDSNADIKATNIQCDGMQCHYDLILPDEKSITKITLNMAGKHNVLNSLAAITVAYLLGVEITAIQSGP